MPLLCALLVAAVVAPSSFFAGPAKVGDSVTYRIATTLDAQSAPSVSTIVLTWKAPAKLYARLAGGTSAGVVAVTRSGDGQLSLAAPNPGDAAAASIATILGQLNFPGHLAATLDGSDHTQTSLNIAPPAPASTASPAPRAPATVNVPLDVNLLNGSSGVTLIAEGDSSRNQSSYGGERGGRGGMGGGWPGGEMCGWHGRSDRNQEQSNGKAPAVDVAMQAIFDQTGVLQHATYRERFTTQSSSGPHIVEHTITIDLVN